MIRFLEPWWLLTVIPVLLLAGAYVWRQLRRREFAMRFTNVDLLHTLVPKGIGWRRHAAAGVLLLSLLALSTAMARPSIDRELPLERATIMLAIDVSLSMQADDVAPNRLEAAQAAAKQFVAELPPTYNLGLVSFAKSANVLVAPSKDRAAVTAAIDSLTLAEATATGEAVFTCLDAIRLVPADGAQGVPPARIVLLSDGFRTAGRPMEEAAAAASNANVPVSTIAFGTDTGSVDIGGQIQRVPVDRLALADLAEATQGYFYEAATASELRRVYEDMGSSIGHRVEPQEITHWYAGIALLLGLVAAGLSLLWTSRLL
jgi:Ca-activated chloride channel family protein